MAEIRPRIPDPKRYNGDSKTLDTWLYSLKVYFKAVGWEFDGDDSERCGAYTVALLEGAALQWHHRQALLHQAEFDFVQLEHALKQQFGILDVERRARNTLRTLAQKSSVAQYIKEFEQVVMYLPTANQDELLHAFMFGLKPHIKSHVLLSNPHSVNEAQTAALTVDDRQEDSLIGFRPRGKSSRNGGGSNGGQRYDQRPDVVPMEIGNMQRYKQGKGKGKYKGGKRKQGNQQRDNNNYQRNYNNNNGRYQSQPPPKPCRHCGGNHWNRDCRNKQASRQYHNMEHQFNKLCLREADVPESSANPHCASCSFCQQNLNHPDPSV